MSMEASPTGWGRIAVSPNAFLSFPYKNFRASIYRKEEEKDENAVQFYYAPALIIDSESAKAKLNGFSGKHEVTFRVTMWNEEYENVIHGKLSERLGRAVPRHSIRTLPIEEIRIGATQPGEGYQVDDSWTSYASQSSAFKFRLICQDEETGLRVCEAIKTDPEMFVSDFIVYYSLETQNSLRRKIDIRADHVMAGQLFTSLQQKFPGAGEVYLQADDAKRLATETALQVIATEVTDGEFAGKDQTLSVSGLVEKLLQMQSVTSEAFSPQMWSSVFWHDNTARPDVITQSMTDLYDKSDSGVQDGMKQDFSSAGTASNASSNSSVVKSVDASTSNVASTDSSSTKSASATSAEVGGSFGGFSASAKYGNNSSLETANAQSRSNESSSNQEKSADVQNKEDSASSTSQTAIEEANRSSKLLAEAKRVVQWNGEKFVPKPVQLTRVNLSQLTSSIVIGTSQITVTRATSQLKSRINVVRGHRIADEANGAKVPESVSKNPPAMGSTSKWTNAALALSGMLPEKKERYIDAILHDKYTKLLKQATPAVYTAGLTQTHVDSKANLRKFLVGKAPVKPLPEKVILVVGATGAGKTTLINGMLNHFFNVQWEDKSRFKVIVEEGEATNQAHSMTQWISSYTVHSRLDSPCPYSLTIIDTPGFGDTTGLARDRAITQQLKELFSKSGSGGIDHIDAVCVVAQAALARLTPTQRYIFDCVLSLFGHDIKENIFLLCTFADDKEPPVLEAVKHDKFPYNAWYPFNNSALFADNEKGAGMFSRLYYDMATKSMTEFYNGLTRVKPKSLLLSREVLKEREKIETAVTGLQQQVNARLARVEAIRSMQDVLTQHHRKIDANKNFTMTVNEPCAEQIALRPGEYVTNCLTCNRTCHYPCGIPNNADKSGCNAITNGNCVICPSQCAWQRHVNMQYRYEYSTKPVQRTLVEVKRAYDFSSNEKVSTEQLLSAMNKELDQITAEVAGILFEMTMSLERLDEIALRANIMSTSEYIEILIQSEKEVQRAGYLQRIEGLNQAKGKAELIDKARIIHMKDAGGSSRVENVKLWLEQLRL